MDLKLTQQLAQIKFSTQILRRLGEELNPSIDQSILELVKNSYDADATTCIVTLSNASRSGGTITISDNGNGMDSNSIINGWLVLGESSKSGLKKTRLGRIPAGSKGLGRLAALRMGGIAQLISIPKNSQSDKYELVIDWKKYDSARLVEEVDIVVDHEKLSNNTTSGSTITIKELKQNVSQREVKRIARGLILLADPFAEDPNAFRPILQAPEFKEMEKLVNRRYFDDADFHLKTELDKTGKASASILDWRGNLLFKASHDEIANKRNGSIYSCPPTDFEFWAFILNATTFSTRETSLNEVREWLKEFGGVHLYENGLRVNPYGNPGNDWLDINLSRAKSPEERPSTNNSIGIVKVKDSKGLLLQKTDRSGFIESDVFHEIRSFCQDTLEWLARRRLDLAEQRRQKTRTVTSTISADSKQTVQQKINTLSGKNKTELQKAFSTYEKTQEDVVKTLRAEIQLYRTLSTAGIMAATFSHESSGNPLKVIEQSIKAIERRGQEYLKGNYEQLLARPVKSILRATTSLSVLGSATLRLLSFEKRRASRVEIHQVLNNVLETFKPFLDGRNVKAIVNYTMGNPFLRSSEAAIESIITNLINNSLVALEKSKVDKRKIYISTSIESTVLVLSVSDNGPGIEGISIKDIWLPGQTTNPNGTGLGLTIVRDATLDLGGTVRAIPHGEHGGAEIIIELPIIGK